MHIKRLQQYNILRSTFATSKWNKHTYEIYETIEAYIYNIGEEKTGPVDSSRQGRSRQQAMAHEHHPHQHRLGLAWRAHQHWSRFGRVGGARDEWSEDH
jgi:hypothetical protein